MSIWLRAAELIETGRYDYACHAIHGVSSPNGFDYYGDPNVEAFCAMFSPNGDRDNTDPFFGLPEIPTNRHRRIVALCFADAVLGKGR